MSTYWGFGCPTHNESTSHWLNHGEDKLRQFWADRTLLQRLIDSDFIQWSEWWCHEALQFARDHGQCQVRLENEYGRYLPIETVKEAEARIRQQMADAGDRRDGDACDQLEAELEDIRERSVEGEWRQLEFR